ncbi:piggyBac transposable element-derived protein 4-like [Pseudomyrmex gracilis]|uniref:piggyBac transposable element-derived protein 4-like n=1 Tax=Pseudomyrmex gracilis TaxID=219809 RepID=UPI000995AFB1|nr:piggyBac transposable element-derived protein 4-like [Pseudomyrmex gracilis]
MNTGGDEAWSSEESEPEKDVIRDRTIACDVDLLDNKRDENIPDVHYDPYFYPSIKTFTEQTNLFQEQNPEPDRIHMKPWTPITEDELWIMIALSINMGHVVKGQLKDYWSQDPLLYTPIYGESLSRNRYLQILRYLHFSNNEEVSNHPLKKIKPVIDHLIKKFGNTIITGEKLCIDGSLVLWKRKLKFKQFLPLNRHRFGMKIFELADYETGFLLDFITLRPQVVGPEPPKQILAENEEKPRDNAEQKILSRCVTKTTSGDQDKAKNRAATKREKRAKSVS